MDKVIKILIFGPKIIYTRILRPIIRRLGKALADFYVYLYQRKKIIKRVYIIALLIANIACLSMYFYLKVNRYLTISVYIGLGGIAGYLLVCLFQFFYGQWINLDKEIDLSLLWLAVKFPKIVKIWGRTRVGKDSLATAISYNLAKQLRQKCEDEMARARRILYFVDFNKVNHFLNLDFQAYKYFKPSEAELKRAFIGDLMCNKGFLKENYLNKYDYEKVVSELVESKEDIRSFKSIWKYSDGVNTKHMYEILFEYFKNYVRYNCGANFIMSNQPFRERDEDNLMAKLFSLRFLEINSGSTRVDKSTGAKFQEIVYWCILEKMIIYETETDTWYNNTDTATISYIKKMGVASTKAYNGHLFGEDTYWIMVGQKAGRVMAILREYDHAYLHVLQKEVIQGGQKRNLILNVILKALDSFINTSEKRMQKKNKRLIYKRDHLQLAYRRIFVQTKPERYRQKYLKYQDIKLIEFKPVMEFLAKKRTQLVQRIEKNGNEGYLRFNIILSDTEKEVNVVQMPLSQILNDRNPLYRSAYQTNLVFKISDSHGRYPTHYLSAVAEDKKQKSTKTYYDVPNWSTDMKLHKDDVLFMGYPSSFKFYNFSAADIAKYREKEIK